MMDGWTFLLLAGVLTGVGGHITHLLYERAARRRAELRHRHRLELEELQHKQRLELADKIDTTMHVLVTDRELACTFDARLAEAMQKAGIPRMRVEEVEDDEEEAREVTEKKSKDRRRAKKRAS